jgi:hypothetical protein
MTGQWPEASKRLGLLKPDLGRFLKKNKNWSSLGVKVSGSKVP